MRETRDTTEAMACRGSGEFWRWWEEASRFASWKRTYGQQGLNQPATVLPLARLVHGFLSARAVSNPFQKEVQSIEINRFHNPGVKSGVNVCLPLCLFKRGRDSKNRDSRVLPCLVGKRRQAGFGLILADHLGGCHAVDDWHLE